MSGSPKHLVLESRGVKQPCQPFEENYGVTSLLSREKSRWNPATLTFGTYIISCHCHHTPAFLHYRDEKYPLLGCLLLNVALLTIFKTYR